MNNQVQISKLWILIFIVALIPDDPINWNGYLDNILLAIVSATMVTAVIVVLVSFIMESFRKIIREEIGNDK
jgi:hypothetical protein